MKCKNCGGEIKYHPKEATFLHVWGRWIGDNGYYCTQERKKHAEPERGRKINGRRTNSYGYEINRK
jgi:hypothetical protein